MGILLEIIANPPYWGILTGKTSHQGGETFVAFGLT